MRFFFSPDGAAVFLPASFFSAGALPAVVLPAVLAGAFCADLGAISRCGWLQIASVGASKSQSERKNARFGCGWDVVDELDVIGGWILDGGCVSLIESNVERKRKLSQRVGGPSLYVCVAFGARTRRITNFCGSSRTC